jgi:hypothetical protein
MAGSFFRAEVWFGLVTKKIYTKLYNPVEEPANDYQSTPLSSSAYADKELGTVPDFILLPI